MKKTPAKGKVTKKSPLKKSAAKKPAAKKPVAKKPTVKASAKPVVKKTISKKIAAVKPAKKPVARPPAPRRPAGIPEQMRDAALKVLDERQAEDILTVDLHGRSSVADYVIIATAKAARQSAAIAHYLREAFGKLGMGQIRVEGQGEGNWVLIDAGDVIVHLFRPEVRGYYNLEQIWQRRGVPDSVEG